MIDLLNCAASVDGYCWTVMSHCTNAIPHETKGASDSPYTIMDVFWPVERNDDFIDRTGNSLSSLCQQ